MCALSLPGNPFRQMKRQFDIFSCPDRFVWGRGQAAMKVPTILMWLFYLLERAHGSLRPLEDADANGATTDADNLHHCPGYYPWYWIDFVECQMLSQRNYLHAPMALRSQL